ncbi:hypothetical protein [Leucobacter sp. 1207-22]|uniref:hypothetical protein n=1 Tax=Leucobacter sp. 1207-22 TaxID=2604456 RepID=UPI004063986D
MANPEKDLRLYFKVPNDFHRHPKVRRLSDAAFRTFIEMIGESRIEDNDGVFTAEDAEFNWDPEVLNELATSHPSRPLIVHDGERYVNREYAKHQQTRGEREEAAVVARRNGAKGGRPRKSKSETQGVLGGNPDPKLGEPSGTQTKPESESESELHDLLLTESVSLGSNGRENLTRLTQEEITRAKNTASGLSVDLEKVIQSAALLDRSLNHQEALKLPVIILAKAKNDPKRPAAYVASVMKNSEFEVQQWIDEEVLT